MKKYARLINHSRKRDKYVLIGVSLIPLGNLLWPPSVLQIVLGKAVMQDSSCSGQIVFFFWNIQTESFRKFLKARIDSQSSLCYGKLNSIWKSCPRRFFFSHLIWKFRHVSRSLGSKFLFSKQEFNIFRCSAYQIIRSESHNSFIHRPLAAPNLVGDPLE